MRFAVTQAAKFASAIFTTSLTAAFATAFTTALMVAAAPEATRAASYPSEPVHIVVGFAPGGGTDVMGRIMAQLLAAKLNGSFVVLNKAGAGAMLGAEYVAKAAPDGYTLLLGTSAELTISPPLYGAAAYDPTTAFVPIAFLGASPAILLGNPNFDAKSIGDVIAKLRQSPGEISIATGGTGTAPDLAAHELKLIENLNFTIVPYKGAGPSQADAIAGHVPLVFSTVASALPLILSQQLRPLAVISQKRSSLVPDVPSAAEAGVKNYVAVTWFGLFAPAGTPPDVVARLRAAVEAIEKEPSTREQFAKLGVEPASPDDTPEALSARIKSELANWTQVIAKAGIKAQE
jgi:tripartite-type tricarboxylate transporter receptor subunit TctC